MIKNVLKKLLIGASLAGIVTVSAAAGACTIETSHPTAKITVEFNSETYELDYTLYRNMYPNTVRHFIELADEGYYNDMLVHHYGSQDWYSGGYTYDEDSFNSAAATESFGQYFEDFSKESAYLDLFKSGKLTPSVYSNIDLNNKGEQVISAEYALPTLIGEFYNNISQEIENGKLTDDYGSLKMFYYSKSTSGKIYVTPTSDQIISADYKYNCATSLFSMQVSSSSSLSYQYYTVFGRIADATSLDELVDAVSDYLEDNYGTSLTDDQTYRVETTVDNDIEIFSDKVADAGIEQTFRLTKTPIIIRSVKITKY